MNEMTTERIVEVITKNRATTVSEIWRGLGHNTAIGGKSAKRIRELVPNHLELFEANKQQVTTAAKSEEQPVTVTTTPVENPVAEKILEAETHASEVIAKAEAKAADAKAEAKAVAKAAKAEAKAAIKAAKVEARAAKAEAKAVARAAKAEARAAKALLPKKTYYQKKEKGAGGFRVGCCLELLYKHGSEHFIDKTELVEKVAAIMNKPVLRVWQDFSTALPYPNHPNNRGRATVIKNAEGDKIKVVPAK